VAVKVFIELVAGEVASAVARNRCFGSTRFVIFLFPKTVFRGRHCFVPFLRLLEDVVTAAVSTLGNNTAFSTGS
jgi:hypothetical protein